MALLLGQQLARVVARVEWAEARSRGETGVSSATAPLRRLHYAAMAPFPRPISQRVGIVGGGLSGLTTALALQLEGHRVSAQP